MDIICDNPKANSFSVIKSSTISKSKPFVTRFLDAFPKHHTPSLWSFFHVLKSLC